MTNERLGELLRKRYGAKNVEGRAGVWRIQLAADGEGEKDAAEGQDEKPALMDDSEDSPPAEPQNGDEDADDVELDGDDVELDGDDVDMDDDAQPNEDAEADDGIEEDSDVQPAEAKKAPGAGDRLPATMIVLTDTRADRMRLMMPIRPFDPQQIDDLRLALIALHANYDRALDARYATQDGILWSVFIHPLESLTAGDLENGLKQVRELRKNTGTTYSSTELQFAPAPAEPGNEV